MTIHWTPEIVRSRFVEACDTERRLPLTDMMRNKSGFWPAYQHTFEDMSGWGTERLKEEREMRAKRIPPSAAAISRFDEVMQWSGMLIDDDTRRAIIWAWARCKATDRRFDAVCKRKGWVKVTAYRRLHATAEAISHVLGNNRVFLRMPAEQWVLPNQPVSVIPDGTLPTHSHFAIFDGDRPRHTLTTPQAIEEFTAHLDKTNESRRKEQMKKEEARRKKLGLTAA